MRPRLVRALCLLAIAGCAAGCKMPEPPGELVGFYSVEGALTKNECGDEALPAADPLSFEVELRKDEGTAYWRQGMPPGQAGVLTDDGAFRFELEQIYDVDPSARRPIDPFEDPDPEALADPEAYANLDPAVKMETCRLTILERVEGTLLDYVPNGEDDAAEPAAELDGEEVSGADLIGDNAITIAVASGFSCGLVLQDQGGPFQKLPCTAHYDLVGTVRDEQE